MEPELKKTLQDASSVFFTLRWSNLQKTDIHRIRTVVPARSGIYEFYYLNSSKQLSFFALDMAWYAGLRAALRKICDPELEMDEERKNILENFPCYYRYVLSDSRDDMQDTLFFLRKTYFPSLDPGEHSGRFEKIFVKEVSSDKITDIW